MGHTNEHAGDVPPSGRAVTQQITRELPAVDVSPARARSIVREALSIWDSDDEIRLTEEGRHLAAVIVRRHRLAERFLTDVLKLPWDKVHAEAEVWETTISDQVEEAMWAALKDPQTCPHGNPIPGAGYQPPKMKPISAMEPGETRLLERISEELELDDEMLGFLYESGFHPKTDIELVKRDPQGALTVSVGGKRVGVGSFAADRLFVAV